MVSEIANLGTDIAKQGPTWEKYLGGGCFSGKSTGAEKGEYEGSKAGDQGKGKG